MTAAIRLLHPEDTMAFAKSRPVGRTSRWMAALAAILAATATPAATVAVLDFELADTTLTDDRPAQVERTARLAPMLRAALASAGIEAVAVAGARAEAANPGRGYLFERPAEAAALGREKGADFIAVCRHDRPSPLFSYLRVRLVDAAKASVIGDYVVEIKGQFEVTAPRGTARLADDIASRLGKR